MFASTLVLAGTPVLAQGGFVCDAYDQTAKRGRAPEPDEDGKVFPIVTIHGITGSDDDFDRTIDKSYIGANPQPPRSLLDALAGSKTPGETLPPGLPGVHVYSFSYTPDSLRWVDNAAVGERFAATIDCLYRLHGKPVSVIAHSMGGLVTRWVANTTDRDGVPRSEKLGKVITLGTPYEGSLLSSVANGVTDLAGAQSLGISFLNWMCGKIGTRTGAGNCGPIPLYSSFRSEAGRNLQVGSRALATLERWPAGMDVTTLAGAQIVPLDLFGSGLSSSVVDIGDIAVQTDSATADPKAGRVFDCRYDSATGTIRTELEEILGVADPRDRQAKLAGAFLASPCYHSNLMRNVGLTNEVLGLLSDWLTTSNLSRPCGSAALAAAYVDATGTEPVSIALVACTPGWVLANVVHPVTGDTDALHLFRVTNGQVELVGDVVPSCAEELSRLGVPDADLAGLGLQVCDPTVGAGQWPTDDNEGSLAFFALQGATARITDWSSCSPDHCIGGLREEVGVWRLRPLDYLGSLDAETNDPLQTLIAAGFSDAEARTLLTPGVP